MNNEQATADGRSVERDSEGERRGEREAVESASDSATEFGITDEDMEQIRSFLAKQRHRRSVDDLRPSSKR